MKNGYLEFLSSRLSFTVPAPRMVAFTSTSSPTSWSWAFGDGSANSTVQNPMHTYTAAGTYNVSLTAANGAGSNTTVKSGYVVVTALNQATDVEGTDDESLTWNYFENVIQYAANIQNEDGYTATSYLQPSVSTINARLPSDSIFSLMDTVIPGNFSLLTRFHQIHHRFVDTDVRESSLMTSHYPI